MIKKSRYYEIECDRRGLFGEYTRWRYVNIYNGTHGAWRDTEGYAIQEGVMSYNIDTWKTKRIENLEIPIKELTEKPYSQYKITPDCAKCTVWLAECGEVSGPICLNKDGNFIMVEEIGLYAEGSGRAYHEILLPALKKSTGILEAVTIWEGGESITRLLVEDGEITETEIEL